MCNIFATSLVIAAMSLFDSSASEGDRIASLQSTSGNGELEMVASGTLRLSLLADSGTIRRPLLADSGTIRRPLVADSGTIRRPLVG